MSAISLAVAAGQHGQANLLTHSGASARGQKWLASHGTVEHEVDRSTLNITHTYVRQQNRSKFVVIV